jgi:tetratricopeptide (TPR) repeat protein
MADWFRNTTWNDSVERAFNEKLHRAKRNGPQYLRIQASTLTRSHPEIALRLLDRYFELPEHFDRAQAYADRATALLALGRVDDAISAYEAALAREASLPNFRTRAYLDLPRLIAMHTIRSLYGRALEILNAHQTELTFAVDHFLWNAVHALIAMDMAKPAVAQTYAERALEVAARKESGFRYHPTAGLVTEQYADVVKKLQTCCRA